MSDYPEPEPGEWVTFHPIVPGSAQRGQVTEVLSPNQWGRACYRVTYKTERKKGRQFITEHCSETVSADRLIPRGPTARVNAAAGVGA